MTVRRAIAALAGALVVAGVVAYGVFGANIASWGCPSQAELGRLHGASDVVDAFADGGLPLEHGAWPPELRRARSYRSALVYRHETAAATLSLLVCPARCELSRFQLRPGTPRRRVQFGFSMLNLAGWIDAPDRGSAIPLRAAVGRVLDRLDRGPDPSSHCYVS